LTVIYRFFLSIQFLIPNDSRNINESIYIIIIIRVYDYKKTSFFEKSKLYCYNYFKEIHIKLKLFIILQILLCFLTSCLQNFKETAISGEISTYQDIPNLTIKELSDLETIKRDYSSLVFGITPSIEAFVNKDGEIKGFAAHFCEWISKFFGIKFEAQILEWRELREKLETGEINFSIHFISSDDYLEHYFVSDPIVERQFIITQIEGSRSLNEIKKERNPRYAFTAGSPTESIIASVLGREYYEAVWAQNYSEAYDIIERGDADALITTRAAEANFISHQNLVYGDFLPLTYSPVSIVTADMLMESIITIINKALKNNSVMPLLNKLYDTGYNEYRHHKFLTSLTEEEIRYLINTKTIPIAVQYFNYPIVFYDDYKKQWDGITFDILRDAQMLTGLKFEVVNNENTEMADLIKMLNDGQAIMFSDLVYSKQRAPYFIWAENKIMPDQFALLSKINHPNINLNEIPQAKIALVKNTAHTEMFRAWFPNAVNTTEFNTAEDAFYAMEHGKVDMVMAAKSKLLYYSNYYEFSGYKANYLFNYFYESAFAYNKEQTVLRSIIDKALAVIDTSIIVEQWITKTYDYRAEIRQARLPWIIGAIIMGVTVITLLLVIFLRNRYQSMKLQREYERIRLMLDTIPVACFIGTINGEIFDCNDEAVRLFELKDKQEFLNNFERNLSPEYQPDGLNSYDELIKHGANAYKNGKSVFNWMHQLLDGTPVPAIVTLESVTYSGKKCLIAYVRDRREYYKMTSEIEKQNYLLITANNISTILLESDINHFEDTLSNAMSIMAQAAGVDRICIWKNAKETAWLRFSLVYQWDSSGFISITKNNIIVPDIWLSDHKTWHETLTNGQCINSLSRDLSPDVKADIQGRNITAILAIPVFLQDHFWGFVSFDRCYKEEIVAEGEVLILRSASRMIASAIIRNETADELINAKKQADKSNRSKSIFLSHMSHEIRTPMNAILGIAEIQMRDEDHSPETMEAFGKIYESGDLLLNLINDILDLSKIESGKLEIAPVIYDIPSLINDTVQLNILRNDSKPIEFILHVDENTPVDIFGDELRIKQILNNILSNAYKYTDQGRIEFYVSSENVKDASNENVIIIFRVTDTGQGMNEYQLSRLFVEYTRFNIESNRTTVGAGLGMNITKRLIDLMNGSIEVKSEPEIGSEFLVRIPQVRIGKENCGKELTEKLQNFHFRNTTIIKKTRFLREYMPYGSVLVVDDVDSNIYVTKGMLFPYGLKIDTASSGFSAIEKVNEGNVYDIIFMDHMMPKMDGIETTKRLRARGYTNPIIALTANALVGRAEMFMKNGFDGFISKPIDSRELNLYLNDFIRNKKPPEVVEAARREQREKNINQKEITSKSIAKTAEMAELFILDAQNAINVLEDFNNRITELNNEELKTYVITVHGMKSTLANIGEKELSSIAFKLEMAGEKNNYKEMTDLTPAFITSLRDLVEKYKPVKSNDVDLSSSDIMYLREKLENIKIHCAKFNKDKAKTELHELKEKKWPSDITEVLDEITIDILHSAFKKVVNVIEKYLSENSE